MVAKGLEIGDLVWAKMKGFPPWPGKITAPPEDKKIKKAHHYVLFYGSDNYAWIPDESISLHNEALVDKYTKGHKRTTAYLEAVEKIVNASKDSSKYQKQKDSESFEKLSRREEPSPKTKSPHSNSIARKKDAKKKIIAKKSPMDKVQKKDVKKRSLPLDRNGADSSSMEPPSKIIRSDADFSNLMANCPPNNYDFVESGEHTDDLLNESTREPTGLLCRKGYIERPATPPINLDDVSGKLKQENIVASTKNIGFLGVGKMGQGIVKNLVHSGHTVYLWNRTAEKCEAFAKMGVVIKKTPYDVVQECQITFCCVTDSEAANSMVFGNWGVLKALVDCEEKGKGFVEMTSLDAKTSIAIGDEVVLKGGRYLEAPIHGTRSQAHEGSLLILCAGDRSLYDDCKSCFQAMARNTFFMSRNLGTACMYNIIHSMLLGTVFAAMAESLALVERVELKQADFLDILQCGFLNNNELTKKGRAMIQSNYVSDTPLKHQQKELNLGLCLGSSVEQPLPITAASNEAYKHCKLLRYADHDVSAIYEGARR